MKNNISKSAIATICLIFILSGLTAQTPNNSGVPAATRTPVAAPLPQSNNDKINFVRTWLPYGPSVDPNYISSPIRNIGEVRQTTTYADGLGRPIQAVAKQAAPDNKDVVTPVRYDAFGREVYKYLPYTANASTGNFQLQSITDQPVMLGGIHSGEQFFYGETVSEASPLNRVLKTMAPGNSWTGSNNGVEYRYEVNTVNDGVVKWSIGTGAADAPAYEGTYAAGALHRNVTIDEQGKKVVEFKDKEERVILKKVELSSNLDGHAGWLCTYSVYDIFGNLRYVIPPKAVAAIQGSWNLAGNGTIQSELCFKYLYDERNRMIMKRVPGAEEVYMAYDTRDRLVFTQDGNMRTGSPDKWLVTFYDGLNRPVMTALYKSDATRDQLQTSMNGISTSTQTLSYNIPVITDLVAGFHDGRAQYKARTSIVFQEGFDTGGSETETILDANATQETVQVTVINPLPSLNENDLERLTYTFYDNYNYAGVHALAQTELGEPKAGSNSYPEIVTAASTMNKGLTTGSKVRILGTDQWLTTTSYYDEKGRTIQTIEDNAAGGKNILSNLYNFTGTLLSSYLHHTNIRSGRTPDIRILTKMAYDAGGRLSSISKKVNSDAEHTIANNTYDAIGQLQTKTLGSNLETLTNEYNVRGWLKSINKGYVEGTVNTNYFGQVLNYDYGFTSGAQLNGNISGTKWRSKGDGITRAYGYQYDAANRLLHAEFSQQNSSGASWTKDQKDFTTSNISYDENGNIQAMNHQGMKANAIQTIDQLSYSYNANSNKLSAVADPYSDPSAGLGDFSNGANGGADYAYDPNGNMTQDLNKNIDAGGIVYNHLNLPETITFTGKGNIRYVYDATGIKQRKIVTDQTISPEKVITTDYLNVFVYENDELQFVGHEEGRIRAVHTTGQPIAFYYDYLIKDYLGNIRTVLTEQPTDPNLYIASMETSSAAKENALFSNIDASRSAKPAGYPQEQSGQNASVAKLNANNPDKRVGPSIVLRVMAGDTIRLGAKAFYKSIGNNQKKAAQPAADMVGSLARAFGNSNGMEKAGVHGGSVNNSPMNASFFGNEYQRLKEKEPGQGQDLNRPKAYLNFVLFNDGLKLVEENSGVKQVKAEPDQLQTLAQDKMVVKESGFLYVYTSNEMAQDVYFDDVTVLHISGPLLEESHYYPFGLTMAGISSKTLGVLENKKQKFQGQPLDNELGLNWYGFKWRNHNPQIGRFIQIDPLSSDYVHNSTYAFSENKVTAHIELEGLESLRADKINNPALRRVLRQSVQEPLQEFGENVGKAVSVKASVGLGVGVKGKVGNVGAEAFLNGPQIEGTVTADGKVTAQAAIVGAGVSAGTPEIGKVKYGVSFATVRLDDKGQITSIPVDAGFSAKIGPSKEVSEGNTSEKMTIDLLSAASFAVGAKLGIVGLDIQADAKAAGKAAVNLLQTIFRYAKEQVKDKLGTNVGGNSGPPGTDEDEN